MIVEGKMKKENLIKTLKCDELCFIKTKKDTEKVEDEIHYKNCECDKK